MTLLAELLAALPAGAAEAVVTQGLDSLIDRIRKTPGVDSDLADDLDLIASNQQPSRPVYKIADDLRGAIDLTLSQASHDGTQIRQEAGDEASQIAVGDVGRDLYVQGPRQPHQR